MNQQNPSKHPKSPAQGQVLRVTEAPLPPHSTCWPTWHNTKIMGSQVLHWSNLEAAKKHNTALRRHSINVQWQTWVLGTKHSWNDQPAACRGQRRHVLQNCQRLATTARSEDTWGGRKLWGALLLQGRALAPPGWWATLEPRFLGLTAVHGLGEPGQGA